MYNWVKTWDDINDGSASPMSSLIRITKLSNPAIYKILSLSTTGGVDYTHTFVFNNVVISSAGSFANGDKVLLSQVFYGTGNTSGFSGYSGRSGYSGYSGLSGYSGYSGPSGFSGYSGISGTSGYSGISGYSGYSGTSGYSGYSGTSGYSGYSGTSGTSGYSGYSGISGYSGYSGTSGYSGYSGTSGYSGYSGTAGLSSITVGSTPLLSGTALRVLWDGGGVIQESPNLTFNGGSLYLGLAGTVTGEFKLACVNSGTINLTTFGTTGNYSFNLPTTAGNAGEGLVSQGGVATAMIWLTPMMTPKAPSYSQTIPAGYNAFISENYEIVDTYDIEIADTSVFEIG